MRISRTRAFKAAALVTLGGVGSTVATDVAGASSWGGLDTKERPKDPGVPGASAVKLDPPRPGDERHPSRDTAGPVIARMGGIAVHDSSKLERGRDDLRDVDADRAVTPYEDLNPSDAVPPVQAPARTAEAGADEAGVAAMAAGELCWGSWFRPRGGNFFPNYDHQLIFWKPSSAPGYELRRLLGMECFGDNQNFSFGQSEGFKASSVSGQYGRQVVHRDGYIFEGCRLVTIPPFGINQYECDFKNTGAHRMNHQETQAWFRQRLKNWALQTAQKQGECAGSIIGTWVGANDLADIGAACIDNGPINPNSL